MGNTKFIHIDFFNFSKVDWYCADQSQALSFFVNSINDNATSEYSFTNVREAYFMYIL